MPVRRLKVLVPLLALPGSGVAQGEAPALTFDHYHTLAEIEAYVEGLAAAYPELVTLSVIGRSREGRPIWAVDVNNPETGPPHEKPGFYVDGNIHGGEVLGGEGALAFLDRLLTRYRSDPVITRLVDTRAFYIVPIVNPDGRAISVDTPENHRWNVRPVDEDRDGRIDEDPPEDLDGDGRVLQMRVPDPGGDWAVDVSDPRRMVRFGRGTASGAPRYRLLGEGVDNDGDGRYNEDRVGGVDLNRNFPANWSAAQFASGPYPLSEPESRALVGYITARPSIAAIHTFHTSGGLLLRFPTLADQDWEFPRADIEAYAGIVEDGVRITGYRNFAVDKQPIVDLMSPGHGVFNDWASNVFGVLAMTTEMWPHALGEGQEALFRWNDEVLGGSGFIAWYEVEHPDLGIVELGGWDRFSTSSPPAHLIADEVDRNVRWVLTFAEKTPQVAIQSFRAVARGPTQVELRASIANVGWMATATAHASEVLGISEPVRVWFEAANASVIEGDEVASFDVLPGARGGEPAVRQVTWQVSLAPDPRATQVTLVVQSEKAGTVRRTIQLPPR